MKLITYCCFFLLISISNKSVFCQNIHYIYNKEISNKQNRKAEEAIAKLGAFYHWYIQFYQKEKYTPLQHIVYKQYLSARLKSMLINTDKPDEFFWQGKQPLMPFELSIQAQKYEKNSVVAYIYPNNDSTWFLRHELILVRGNYLIHQLERIIRSSNFIEP